MTSQTPQLKLFCHRDSACLAVRSIEVELAWRGDNLCLAYRVAGDARQLSLPQPVRPGRQDNLWQHTCFELFMAGGATAGGVYVELNFSPSTRWAAYRFDGYRQGMAELPLSSAPDIRVDVTPAGLVVHVVIDWRGLMFASRGGIRLGLAAVIEERDRTLSYWALAHPSLKPDFHHPDGFIATLPDNVG